MKAFSNKRIKVASKDRARIDLSGSAVTTNDFGVLQTCYCREVIPGDQFTINMRSFARLAPMPVPTYANICMVNRAYFVKMKSIWKPFEDFYAGRSTYIPDGYQYSFTEVPYVTNTQLYNYFMDANMGLSKYPVNNSGYEDPNEITSVYDFLEYDGDYYYPRLFTTKGKRFYSFLKNIGISVNFTPSGDDTKLSLLKFLAYTRIYYDHFIPSRYSNDNPLRIYFNKYVWNTEDVDDFFYRFVDLMNVFYDDDYFTSSWITPYSPTPTQDGFDGLQIKEPSAEAPYNLNDPNRVLWSPGTGAKLFSGYTGSSPFISQFGIDALKKIYDFGMRRGLAGNKYFETIFSEFGIQLPEYNLDISQHIGSSVTSVMTQDVTSTAQTDNNGSITALGDYAGKGHAYDESINYSYESKDFGYLMVVTYIIPDTGYVQGTHKENTHINRLDFFTSEFDKLGMQAISNREIFSDYKDRRSFTLGQSYGGNPNGVFGFTPRYSEYKVGYSILSGDFVCKSISADMDAYHTYRIFNPPSANNQLTNGKNFRILDLETNGNGFTRIFNDTNTDVDHFICSYDIQVSCMRKMSSIKDSFELDGGQEISVDTN